MLVALPTFAKNVPDVKVDLLETKTGVYSNVTVTTRADQYVVIHHSQGIGTIKVTDLSRDLKKQLGYAVPPSDEEKSGAKLLASAKRSLHMLPDAKQLMASWNSKSRGPGAVGKASTPVLIAILGAVLLLYLFFCHCASRICQKTGQKPGLLVWLPLLQMIPLYRAAGMSPMWFLALFVPVLNLVVQIMWCFKIAKALGKGALTGLFLLLPITSPLAFVYLASSGEAPVQEKPKKYVSSSMTFDTA